MVYQLLVPDKPSALGIQRQQRVGETIAAETLAAVEIRARRARRHQHQAVFLIHGHDAPGVTRAGCSRLGRIPFARGRMRRRVWNRIEAPDLGPGTYIERPDDTALHVRRAVIAYRRADDHDIVVDGRWRGDEVVGPIADTQATREVDLAARAEIHTKLASRGIQREQTCVQCASEHAARARSLLLGTRVLPDTHSARGCLGVMTRAVHAWIETPALPSGLRFKGNYDVRGCLEVQQTEREHGRRFEGKLVCPREPCPELTGAIGPRDGEARDILAVDLIEARETLTEHVAAVIAPVARIGRLGKRARACRDSARGGGQCGGGPHQAAHSIDRTPRAAARLVFHAQISL